MSDIGLSFVLIFTCGFLAAKTASALIERKKSKRKHTLLFIVIYTLITFVALNVVIPKIEPWLPGGEVKAKMLEVPVFSALKKYQPEAFENMAKKIRVQLAEGNNLEVAIGSLQEDFVSVIIKTIPSASNHSVFLFSNAIDKAAVEIKQEMKKETKGGVCKFISTEPTKSTSKPLSLVSASTKHSLSAALVEIIESAGQFPQYVPAEKEALLFLKDLALRYAEYDHDETYLLKAISENKQKNCEMIVALNRTLLRMEWSEEDKGKLIRYLTRSPNSSFSTLAKVTPKEKALKIMANSMFTTIQQGDTSEIDVLLAEGFGINEKLDKNGETPLHVAASSGNKGIAELLLSKGAYVDATDDRAWTPLTSAMYYGNVEIVKLLLAHGGAVNPKFGDDHGFTTPLYLPVVYGSTEIVEAMLAKGADPNVRISEEKWTPLHLAARHGNQELVDLLLKYRANINAQMIDGRTPLMYALNNKRSKIAKTLINLTAKADIDIKSPIGGTALHHAVESSMVDIVQELIAKGADVNAEGFLGISALDIAIVNKNNDIAKLLESRGALVERFKCVHPKTAGRQGFGSIFTISHTGKCPNPRDVKIPFPVINNGSDLLGM